MAAGSLAFDIVLKEGWVVKESGQAFMGQMNWRKRWCRLTRNAEGQVSWAYYRKKEDIAVNQPAGWIHLDSTYLARDLETDERKKKPNCFALGPLFDDRLAKRTYYISCDTEEDKLLWMELIGAAIETETQSSVETINRNRRQVRSRMERRTKKNRQVKTQSSPARLPGQPCDYLDPKWRLEQWQTMCAIIANASWKKTDTKNGLTLSRLSFKCEQCASIKGEGVLAVPPEIVYDYLLTALRPGGKFDHPFRQENVLHIIDDSLPHSSVVSNTYNTPLPSISTRECCLVRTWMPSYITQDQSCGLVLTSIPNPHGEPTKPSSMRVYLQPSGFVLYPTISEDGYLCTRACFIAQVDLQDSLQSMLESTFKSGLLKIGIRNVFSHIKSQIEKYFALIQS